MAARFRFNRYGGEMIVRRSTASTTLSKGNPCDDQSAPAPPGLPPPQNHSIHLPTTPSRRSHVLPLFSLLKGFLTIGVPTVKRKIAGTTYLKFTLQSLIDETSPDEKRNTVVLVFTADLETEKRKEIVDFISSSYPEHLASGFVRIMQVARAAYPRLEGLKRNYNDADDRVKWRSKQVVDFAFMFHHGRRLSQYYIQLEDDVKVSTNFITNIKLFIDNQAATNSNWAVLDFSELGFIGKLFKCSDLERFSKFLMMFYQEMPVDWLVTFFHQLLTQKKKILRKPTLFQHMGEFSSFASKGKNKLKDRYFAGGRVQGVSMPTPLGKNPPAEVCTTIEHYHDYLPMHGYNDASGSFFWGKRPTTNDTFTISFNQPVPIKNLYIETGHSRQQNDYLRRGYVQVSQTESAGCACQAYSRIGVFSDGKFVGDRLEEVIKYPVKCVQIVVSQEQEEWLIISEISPS